jgi:hypothetical protein
MNSVCSCDGPVIAASKSMDNNMCCLRRGVVVVPHGESSSGSRKVCGVARAFQWWILMRVLLILLREWNERGFSLR